MGPHATVPGTMVPVPEARPDTLPTARLGPSGMPRPELRDELRRIPGLRNGLSVVSVWVQTAGVLAVACAVTPRLPLGAALVVWAGAFLAIGRGFALFSILAHEAAHRLLFSRRAVNDTIGRWLLAYPAFVPFHAYRRVHFAHHKDEMGPNEPDLALYRGYPIPTDSFRRKLTRDALGVSGYKNMRGLVRAFRMPEARPVTARIVGAQLVLFAGFWTLSGRWWLYPLFWLAPWMTVWRVLNRLRSIAEHGGMVRSKDRRETTHVVRQTRAARFWIVPYNTGWHLAHHVDMGVPFRGLPRLHAELVQSGWVTPALEYPSYTALWRAMVRPTDQAPEAEVPPR